MSDKYGKNLEWILTEISCADEIEDAWYDIYGEDEHGVEGSAQVDIRDLCGAAAETIKSLQSEIAKYKEICKMDSQAQKNLKAEIALLKQPQWVRVDGAESDLKLEGYYWWNPRYSENREEENWQVVYCNPKGTDMINRQGLFSGPLPTPPEAE